MIDLKFFKGKKILITGHTGFKGTWLCRILIDAGANVTGYALEPPTQPSLFEIINILEEMNSIIRDIRDFNHLKVVFDEFKPEIVIHLAAQPIVRLSYLEPAYTYETNVMGTVNILECVRKSNTVKSFLNVTTDKVYKNKEWEWAYRENEELNGFDPYSNSKSCSELITSSYKNSFFNESNISISTARAGNVIGGGDFAQDRIIPDCVRAVMKNETINVRNPYSIRPYQHVLDPLFAYLMIIQKQYGNKKYEGSYNIGPNESDCVTTKEIVELFCNYWGESANWKDISNLSNNGLHEANFLKLDCSKIKQKFQWKPVWNIKKAINATVDFSKSYMNNENLNDCMRKQIQEFISDSK